MLFNEKKYEFEIDGRKCSFSTGKLALKSESSILAKMGDTVITVNVNSAPASSDAGYFPMSVEYIEKFYASGKINGSRFVKRERFPSDDAILKARMIDRSVRCRVPKDYRNEVNVIVTVMSYDGENDPVILAINAVSAALMYSNVPFAGPVAGVRMGMVDGKHVPIYKTLDEVSQEDKMNYMVSGDGNEFTMIDAGCFEIPEEEVLTSMKESLTAMKPWIDAQNKFLKQLDIKETPEYDSFAVAEDLFNAVVEFVGEDRAKENLLSQEQDKHEATKEELFTEFEGKFTKQAMVEAYDKLLKKTLRKVVLETDTRVDGRKLDEIREVACEVGLLPKTHGTGLFTRGKTQTLTVATLGSLKDVKLVDDMMGESEKRYMHFYNDLPFAYGDVGRVKLMPSRRGIGHGALGEKALVPVIPSKEEFPYTIVVMSEIQGENGSSSMASSCGSSLALMDAGVPIRKPVAGIAFGLVTAEDGTFKLLADMQGVEDFYGDMDFKITGTRDGVTAVQMDTKLSGLSWEVVEKTFAESKKARLQILDIMKTAIEKPRESVSENAPKVATDKIPVSKIGELIGPGGKNIKELTETTGAEISVEEDGTVNIYANDQESIDAAMHAISGYSFVPEEGKVYDGVVKTITEYGAFVDIAP
jgi:polyribonucleotide nucleotidyltransferase